MSKALAIEHDLGASSQRSSPNACLICRLEVSDTSQEWRCWSHL